MKINGIHGRLLFILGAVAVMVLSASISALVGINDVSNQLDTVNQKELPAITAALGLAQIGERLQYQGSVLMTTEEYDDRVTQQRLIEEDMAVLVAKIEELRSTSLEGQVIISSISATAMNLNTDLIRLNTFLIRQSGLTRLVELQRNLVRDMQEKVKQLLGPSILAVQDIVNQPNSANTDIYQSAIHVLSPLLSAERLVSNSVENLLQAISTNQLSTIDQARKQFERTKIAIDLLVNDLPAGLQARMALELNVLERQLGTSGIFKLRQIELDTLKNANGIVVQINRDSSGLKKLVDDLVGTTNVAIGNVTTQIGKAVVKNTLWFVVGSIAVVIGMTLLSWYLVVRPVGKNLIGVTDAMTLLANGEREVQVPAMNRKDEIGDLARAFTVFKDNISHMDFLDRELSEKSGLLVTTFDNMNDGFTVFDADRKLIAWNPQFLNIYGLSSDFVVVGRSIEDIHQLLRNRGVHFLTALGDEVPIDKLTNYRETETLRYELQLENARTIELRSNPVPSGGFVTIHMDISERLATEAQLRQAQKMEMVGQLTGGIAHDFNNILAVLIGNLYILDRALSDDPVLKDRITRALGAADRATRQVERLLAFSRRQQLEPESVEVNELISDMMDLLGYSLGSEIELITDFADGLAKVLIDPGQLENALMNLAVNARDALKGRGQIIFSTRQLAESFVEIAVKDNGMGMPAEIADHVFEPFFTTKSTGKGSGLGLSMVYGFITQSGGSVHLSSRPRQGTTIALHLPVASIDNRPPGAEEVIPPPGQGEKILVVDDDTDLLEITAEQVKSLGYQVFTADGGESALRILDDEREIRLLYTDIVMPDPWNGVALAREAHKRRPDLAILFTSAETSDLLEPGQKVMKKPVAKERLARNLKQILDHQAFSTSASRI